MRRRHCRVDGRREPFLRRFERDRRARMRRSFLHLSNSEEVSQVDPPRVLRFGNPFCVSNLLLFGDGIVYRHSSFPRAFPGFPEVQNPQRVTFSLRKYPPSKSLPEGSRFDSLASPRGSLVPPGPGPVGSGNSLDGEHRFSTAPIGTNRFHVRNIRTNALRKPRGISLLPRLPRFPSFPRGRVTCECGSG